MQSQTDESQEEKRFKIVPCPLEVELLAMQDGTQTQTKDTENKTVEDWSLSVNSEEEALLE